MIAERLPFSSCSLVPPSPTPPQQIPGWNESSDALCHDAGPTPIQRRMKFTYSKHLPTSPRSSWLALIHTFLLALTLYVGKVDASSSVHPSIIEPAYRMPDELIFDTREPPTPSSRVARRDGSSTDLPQSIVPSSTLTASGDSGATSKPLHTATTPTQSALPKPFDSSLGNNFTSTACPAFFNNFLSNDTFQKCLPFSLLLQTSNSFFVASRSLVTLTNTLDATCNVDFAECSNLMASLAQEIQSDDTCGEDLQMENPMVQQAYNGFIAYEPLYHAGCYSERSDGRYCFANAVTNSSATTGSYIYYLPLGVQLPGGTRPPCNDCMQSTMAIFAQYARNSSQPLAETYQPAAEQIDMTCGPRFVEAAVQTAGSMSLLPPSIFSGLAALVVVAAIFGF